MDNRLVQAKRASRNWQVFSLVINLPEWRRNCWLRYDVKVTAGFKQ